LRLSSLERDDEKRLCSEVEDQPEAVAALVQEVIRETAHRGFEFRLVQGDEGPEVGDGVLRQTACGGRDEDVSHERCLGRVGRDDGGDRGLQAAAAHPELLGTARHSLLSALQWLGLDRAARVRPRPLAGREPCTSSRSRTIPLSCSRAALPQREEDVGEVLSEVRHGLRSLLPPRRRSPWTNSRRRPR
jgi:hypothetical protein